MKTSSRSAREMMRRTAGSANTTSTLSLVRWLIHLWENCRYVHCCRKNVEYTLLAGRDGVNWAPLKVVIEYEGTYSGVLLRVLLEFHTQIASKFATNNRSWTWWPANGALLERSWKGLPDLGAKQCSCWLFHEISKVPNLDLGQQTTLRDGSARLQPPAWLEQVGCEAFRHLAIHCWLAV